MKSSINTALIDNYFGLVNSLDRENKIKLMAKLSISIADEKVGKDDKKNVVDRFFGAFKSKKNTDEIISKIREGRVCKYHYSSYF